MTKKRILDNKAQKKVKKLGPCATFLTLIKGFVCSAVIYLPKSFVNGGWGFSIIVLVLCAFLTIYCALLLLEIRAKMDANSYTDIGKRLFGPWGKFFVNLALCLSQFGFVCAYIYYLMVNYNHILYVAFGLDIDRNYFAILCLVMWSLLCYVRKIEIFSSTHVFADIMIVLTIVIIMIYGCIQWSDNGHSMVSTVPFFNPVTYSDAIGFALYSYEGIGVILPIQDITRDPSNYKKIVVYGSMIVNAPTSSSMRMR